MISEEDRRQVQGLVNDVKYSITLRRNQIKADEEEDKSRVLAFYDPQNGPMNYSNLEIKARYMQLTMLEEEINVKVEAIYHNLQFQQTTIELIKRSAEQLIEKYVPQIEKI